jgi:phage protein D
MPERDAVDTLTPAFRVEVDGAEVPEALMADIRAVRVLEDLHATGMFSLNLSCWDTSEMRVKWIDDKRFDEGTPVSIYMGYGEKIEKLFTGEINGLEPNFNTEEASFLIVRGYDRAHKLMRRRKTKSYLQMKDSDIAGKIASEAGLRPEVEDTKIRLEYVLQHNQTDFEFLRDRAARIGFEVFVSDNKLYFRQPNIKSSPTLTLRRERELLEFYPRSTTLNQVEEVKVQGWDFKSKEAVTESSKPGDVLGNMGSNKGPQVTQKAFSGALTIGVRSPVFSQEEAKALAAGMMNDTALTYVTGEGLCIGTMELRPGKVIKIEDLGTRFSGSYYVTSTEHSFLPHRGYRTAFTVRRNATG